MSHARHHFASDNCAEVHPAIFKALEEANRGHALAYGHDAWTERAIEVFQHHFGPQSQVFFVYNGTGANVLSLSALTRSFHGIFCSEMAHIQVDECGAPEKFSQCKLIDLPVKAGRLDIETIRPHLVHRGNEHHVQGSVISITQATEVGTVYRLDELKKIGDFAHEQGLTVHMDGARIANAAEFLGVDLRTMVTDTGVDILSFGGTKNGCMFGEAVVVLKPDLIETFPYIRKQGMQLASKMRFIAAQFSRLLEEDLWLTSARHANRMAGLLRDRIEGIPGVTVIYPVEINALFVKLPLAVIPILQESFFFYVWDEAESVVRWMTAFDTTEEDVDNFATLVEHVCRAHANERR